MSVAFEKIQHYLKKQNIDIEAYFHYLHGLEKQYEVLSQSLIKRNIALRAYHDFLEKKNPLILQKSEIPADVFTAFREIGIVLLEKNRLSLEEINPLLQTLFCASLTVKGFLLLLFQKQKISLEEFVTFCESVPHTQASSYELGHTENGLQFFFKSILKLKKIGSYELFEVLGEGGMGIVYKAYHHGLNQTSAIKLIKSESQIKEKTVQRFLREMQVLAKLDHPGIVKILNSGEENGRFYLVMEYIFGVSLEQKSNQLTLREKIEILVMVLEALSYAHQKNIIHRDLKLGNILVSENGLPKIVDFGLAKELEEDSSLKLTQSGILLGTVLYMAPEQIGGDARKIDARTDLYAIAVCLYKLISNQYPYSANTLPELMRKIEEEEPPLLSKNNPNIHRDLDAILWKGLAKSPEKRYQTAEAFAQDLQRFLMGVPVEAPFPSLREYWKRKTKKYLLLLQFFLYGTFFCILLMFALIGWQSFNKTQQLKENHFATQKLFLAACQEKDIAIRKEKILESLHQVNQILREEINPKTEELKWQIGNALIRLAYTRQSYIWANYLIEELEPLTTLATEKKTALKNEFQEEKKKELKQQTLRLNHWLVTLKKTQVSPEEELDAIYDILKMSNKEVVLKVGREIQIGIEGVFSQNPFFEKEFLSCYKTLLKIAKYWKKPELAPILKAGIQLVSKHLDLFRKEQKEFEKLDVLILLFQAVLPYSTEEEITILRNIRLEMGIDSLFDKRTQLSYERWLKIKNRTLGKEVSQMKNPFLQGSFYLDSGHYEKAILSFSQAILQNPGFWEPYTNRAFAKDKLNDLNGAIADYTQAIRLYPHDENTFINRGNVQMTLKNFERAFADYREAIRLHPQSSNAYYNLGRLQAGQGSLEEAIASYTESIRFDSFSFESYLNRGSLYLKLNHFTEAIDDFSDAIRLYPQYSESYNKRGNAKLAIQDLPGALEDYTHSIELNPQNYIAYYNRGNVKTTLKDFTGALSDYNESIRIRPDYAIAYFNRAYVKTDLQDLTGAVADYSEVIRIDPNMDETYQNRGLLLMILKENEQALLDFNEAIRLKGGNANLYKSRGKIKFYREDFDGAILDLTESLRQNPEDPEAYLNRGFCYSEKQEMEKAKSDFLRFFEYPQPEQFPEQILEAIYKLFPELKK